MKPPAATADEDRVDRVETFLVDGGAAKDWVWVRLESAAGVVGWGECYTVAGREPAVRAIADELGGRLVGREVGAIRHFTSTAYRDFATKRGSMEVSCAVSGLEQALWDVLGKTLGRPVHALLGGPCRARFRVYANGWSYGASGGTDDVAAAVARAQELVASGWNALKFDPFRGPWRPFVSPRDVDAAVACVAAVREAVGAGVDLLVEAHRRLAPAAARRFALELRAARPVLARGAGRLQERRRAAGRGRAHDASRSSPARPSTRARSSCRCSSGVRPPCSTRTSRAAAASWS